VKKAMPITGQTGCPVQADFDPLSPVFLADPFAVLKALPTARRRTI